MTGEDHGRLDAVGDDLLVDEKRPPVADRLPCGQLGDDIECLREVLRLKEVGKPDAGIAILRPLCEKYHDPMYAQILRHVRTDDEARSLIQTVPLHAWNALPAEQATRDPRGWLLQLASDAALAYCRASDREQILHIRAHAKARHKAPLDAIGRPLFERYQSQILWYIRRLVASMLVARGLLASKEAEDLALDLTQTVMVKACAFIKDDKNPPENFHGWIFKVATNEVKDHRRSAQRHRRRQVSWDPFVENESSYLPSEGHTAPQEDSLLAKDLLSRGLQGVDEEYLKSLLLVKYHGFKAKEAGAILNPTEPVPEGTVNWHVHEAKKQFLRAIADSSPGQLPPGMPSRRPQPRDPDTLSLLAAADAAQLDIRSMADDAGDARNGRRQRQGTARDTEQHAADHAHGHAHKPQDAPMKEDSHDGRTGD